MPAYVWAQSPDHVTPQNSPLLWRDGYVNWRGKLVKPNWQMMSADDGTKFAIDLSKKPADYAAAYIIDGEAFNKANLFELQFDCAAKVFEVVTNMDLKRYQIVGAKVRQLVCDDAPKAPGWSSQSVPEPETLTSAIGPSLPHPTAEDMSSVTSRPDLT